MMDKFKDICVVIQGPTSNENVMKNKKCWEGIPIIFSTWVDSDKTAYDLDNDIVIFNEYPKEHGVGNWNLQRVSTLNGIILAKKLGYKRVLKWRSDFMTNNGINLYNLFDFDKMNFWSFIPHDGGYVTDYFMEGDINQMYELFNFESNGPFAEKIMTKRLFDLNFLDKINFICKKLNSESDVYWIKSKYWLSQNKQISIYQDTLGEINF
jgi:hypothetical protein